MSSPVRVIVVDDHPIFRMGLAAAIREMDGIEVVAEADHAAEVCELVALHRPDVVLLDLNLPDGSGLEVNRQLASDFADCKVIVLTMSEDSAVVLAAIRDGARGYIVKGVGPDRVEQALHTVAAGDVVLSPELAQGLANSHAEGWGTSMRRSQFPALTAREHEVLDLMAAGLNNQTIARRLYVNPKTVRNHVSNIFAKIHAADRSEAIVLARQAGLGDAAGKPN